jgi:putative transposase
MHIDLEAASATSAGLCLTHIVSDKSAWLAHKDIDGEWPIQGKPLEIGVDNAREFKSQAFLRGCAQHGIMVNYRPPGLPHFGGVIERVIGTLMKIVHEAPGTTKSNLVDRGKYDSEGKACLTFEEFERYLTIAITQYYHHAFHHGLGDAPIRRLRQTQETHPATSITNPQSYLIDFLPVSRRTLRREGFVLDHITYYSSAFQNWLREGKLGETFVIRRDPRDLSRIYVSVPEGSGYIEAAYRKLSHPVITLFEHRAAVRRLSSHAKSTIDEEKLFRAIEEMRRIETESTQATLKKRREKERKRRASEFHSYCQLSVKQEGDSSTSVVEEKIVPFQEIELW